MKLSDTIKMMNSDDYKERFRAEYFQLQNRISSFDKTLSDYRKNDLKFETKCTLKLMDGQMNAMIIYRTHLEAVAKVEGISLEEIVLVDKTINQTDPKAGDGK